MVVDQPLSAVGQHAQGVHRLGATVGMDAVVGQIRCAGDMEPVQAAGDAQAALIHVDHGGLDDGTDDGALHRGQCVVGVLVGLGEGAQAQGLAEEVETSLTQPPEGKELLVEQIERQPSEIGAVLHRAENSRRKIGADLPARDGASFDFGLMLGHRELEFWQIEHLASFVIQHRLSEQRHAAALAARTAGKRVNHDVLGLGDRLQGVAGVTGLAAGLAPGFAAQAAWRWFAQAIAGGWAAAVAAVLREACFQLGDARFQLAHPFLQRQHVIDDGLGARPCHRQQFLAPGHAASSSRKWATSGRTNTALRGTSMRLKRSWRVRPVVSPTGSQLAAR